MKKCKLLLILATIATVMFAVSCNTLVTHNYGDWEITKNPTYTEAGYAQRSCTDSDCDHVDETAIPALSDVDIWTLTNVAEDDVKHVYTSAYGSVEVDHVYGEWTITANPTDSEVGSATRKCTGDNNLGCGHVQTAVVPVLTDTSVWTVSEIDGDDAEHAYTSVYGSIKANHVYGAWEITTAPSVTEEGEATKTCSVCGHNQTATLPVLTDTAFWILTEGDDAKHVYTSDYGTVTINHNYGEWDITEATATVQGSATRTCDVCDHVQTVTLPVLTDTSFWNVKYTAPTYTADGSNVYTAKDYDGIVITVTIEKLVPPYIGKTYTPVEIDYADEDDLSHTNRYYAWGSAVISIDANGVGIGWAAPLRSMNTVTLVDALTGEINIHMVSPTTYDEEDETHQGLPTYDQDDSKYVFIGDGKNVKAYIDTVTGIIIMSNPYNGSFMDVYVLTPFGNFNDGDAFKSSAWAGSIAMSYAYGDGTLNAYINDGRVYFGATFEDIDGNAVDAENCSASATLYVKDADGNVIGHFVHDGNSLVITDGIEGTYTATDDELATLTINGNGVANTDGTYMVADDGTLQVYVNGAYYEITLDVENKTMTVVKPMVTITFVSAEGTVPASVSVNKNVAFGNLPTIDDGNRYFNGWCFDEEFTNKVGDSFVPTSDTTLYAYWVDTVTLHIIDSVKGNQDKTVKVEADKTIGDLLAEIWDTSVDYDKAKIFVGWYLDAEFVNALPEEAYLDVENDGISIYAKWDDAFVQIGKYNGFNLYGTKNDATVSNDKTLTVNADGTYTGDRTGTIDVQYKSVKDGEINMGTYAYFNAEAGIIWYAYRGNNTTVGTDTNIFFNNFKSGTYSGSVVDGHYVAWLTIVRQDDTTMNVFCYNDKVYANVSWTEGITAGKANNAKNLVVYDSTGKGIVAKINGVFRTFDGYQGTYTDATLGEVVLDGIGNITVGDKTGTYTVVNAETKTFDVYFDNGAEYYSLVLDGETATLTKVMVTVSFDVDGGVAMDALTVNKNIAITLADAVKEGYVFRGWFSDEAFENAVDSDNYVPTADVTLYAKLVVKVTVTVHFDNGEDDLVKDYASGETFDVADPKKADHKFDGWYTTSTFDEGTEFNGGEITADTEIWAKWSAGFAQQGTYTGWNMYGADKSGSISRGTKLTFNADGSFSGSKSGQLDDKYSTVTDGAIDIGTYAYFNKVAGIVWYGYRTSTTSVGNDTYIFFSENVVSGTYSGTNTINGVSNYVAWLTLEMADGSTMNVFCYKDKVYANVTWDEGVTAKDANGKSNITVYGSDGKALVAKVNGTFFEVDGYQGTYTDATLGEVVLNGVTGVTFDGKTAKYTLKDKDTHTFDVYVYDGNKKVEYYTMVLDVEAKTATIEKPMASITFDYNGHGDNTTDSYNVNIPITLPTVEDVEGFKFRYWYQVEETKLSSYTPTTTDAVTLTAKWDPTYTFTAIFGNDIAEYTVVLGSGDKVVASNLTYSELVNGQYLKGWYTIGEDGAHVAWDANMAITADTTVYAEWADAYAQYGKYTGFNMYGANQKGASLSRTRKTANISATGVVTGSYSGTIASEYSNVTDGAIQLGSYGYAYFNQTAGIIWTADSSGKTGVTHDTDILFSEKVVDGKYSGTNKINDDSAFVAYLTLTMKDGSTMNVFCFRDKVYANVTWNDGITAENANSEENLVIRDSNGTPIVAKIAGRFFNADGLEGTYMGTEYGNIILDGYTGITIGETKTTYTVEGDNKISFVLNGVTVYLILDPSFTYTVATDGNEGTYALPDDGGNVVFDGYGNVSGALTGTYLVNGASVTITTAEGSTTYGFDKANHKLLGKSIFAGLTFTGKYNDDYNDSGVSTLEITFADSALLEGAFTIKGYGTDKCTFTATLEDNVIKFTLVSSNGMLNGKVITATVSGNSIKITDIGTSLKNNPAYKAIANATVTCADFSF